MRRIVRASELSWLSVMLQVLATGCGIAGRTFDLATQ
jgi:hypothetical protein